MVVNWGDVGAGNNGKLIGLTTYRKKKIEVDVFAGTGVYVLYNDYKMIYVGKTDKLGSRLRNHLTNRMEGRWDSFSFYLVNKVNMVSESLAASPKQKQVKSSEICSTLEALLIDLANPPLNRKRESIPGAVQLEQLVPKNQKKNIDYLREIAEGIAKLEAQINHLS